MADVIRMRERKFCGLGIDQLKALSVKELASYLPARSRRSLLRHPEVIERFLKSAEDKVSRKKKIRTHLRDLVIVPRMVGMNIQIYNGKSFEQMPIEIEMIGHRLGEFALTRQKVNHSAAGIGATRGSKAAKK
ncbi:ribosomal protein S19 family protein [Candidatus Pacearchaeota archaeon]|nr:ribosomal protein S19 family protein [Candidatus Pacearchaeota archaeon]